MAGGGEIQFPEPIIQRLQSFLTGKEAARTTIVSKSWHSAWLTRPNLDFYDTHFIEYYDDSGVEFWKYAKKTIKRYEKSSLKIESFKLCMKMEANNGRLAEAYNGRPDLANKLVVKALRIGATRLCIQLDKSFVLPHEVFAADNLVGLSVSGCRINLDDGVVVKCRRLESLILDDRADITIDALFNIISRCPSIEKLSLLPDDEMGCTRLGKEKLGRWAAAMAVGLVDNHLHRLRCLVVSYVSFKTLRLGDLLSRFPLLKDFTLYLKCNSNSIFEEEIQISNCSLERVNLELEDKRRTAKERRRRPRLRVKLDVPSVRKFTFEGDTIPCLSFMSIPSREWESHVSINCGKRHSFTTTFWFDELSEFLTKLSQSKTHLSLHVGNGNTKSFDYKLGDDIIQGLRKHELENLSIDMRGIPSLSCYALFDGLFRLCRPKLITPYYMDDPDKQRYSHRRYDHNNIGKTNIDFLCQTLEQGINIKVPSPAQFLYGLNDLEEVNALAFDVDDVPAEWRPIPLESLLDVDALHEHIQAQQRVRLLLKWKPS